MSPEVRLSGYRRLLEKQSMRDVLKAALNVALVHKPEDVAMFTSETAKEISSTPGAMELFDAPVIAGNYTFHYGAQHQYVLFEKRLMNQIRFAQMEQEIQRQKEESAKDPSSHQNLKARAEFQQNVFWCSLLVLGSYLIFG